MTKKPTIIKSTRSTSDQEVRRYCLGIAQQNWPSYVDRSAYPSNSSPPPTTEAILARAKTYYEWITKS